MSLTTKPRMIPSMVEYIKFQVRSLFSRMRSKTQPVELPIQPLAHIDQHRYTDAEMLSLWRQCLDSMGQTDNIAVRGGAIATVDRATVEHNIRFYENRIAGLNQPLVQFPQRRNTSRKPMLTWYYRGLETQAHTKSKVVKSN